VTDDESETDKALRAVAAEGRLSTHQRQAVSQCAQLDSGRVVLRQWVTLPTYNALRRAGIADDERALTEFGILVRTVTKHGKDKVLADAEKADAGRPRPDHVRELIESGAAVLAVRAELKAIREEEIRLAARKKALLAKESKEVERRGRAIRSADAKGMDPGDIATAAQMTRTTVFDHLKEKETNDDKNDA
jgi:hypothetical protein